MDRRLLTIVGLLAVFQGARGQLGYYPSAGIQTGHFGLGRAVAVPHTGPAVVAIHAQRPQVISQGFPTAPVAVPALPVAAVAVPAQVSVPNYSFGYVVKDSITGDEKSHQETRTGNNVVGRYSIVEPDGALRVVSYTAGAGGFNAVVERTAGYAPPNAPAVVAVSRPVAITAPVAVARPIPVARPPVIAVSRPVSITSPIAVASPVPVPVVSRPPVIAVSRPLGSCQFPCVAQSPNYPPGFHFGG